MATNYRFGYNGNSVDFDDYFVRLDFFATGNLWGWGRNDSGQLGDNSLTQRNSPVQTVAYGHDWQTVSCGQDFSMGIKADGTLWGWGKNSSGQLANGTNDNNTSPTQANSNSPPWKTVTCGQNFSSGIKADGTLWTWGGNNGVGILGINNTTPSSRNVPGETSLGGNDWKLVSAGFSHILAIKTDGSLWAWGENTFGELGNNSTTTSLLPIQIGANLNWDKISCGENFSAAIKTDGTLWTWGLNGSGQLGDNSVVDKSSPAQTKAAGTNWKQVSCGNTHVAAIKTDGTLWTWGLNSSGQLGDNSVIDKSSPAQTNTGGTNWRQVSCGGFHTVTIKTDGTLWGWGENFYGAVGDDTTTNRTIPVANKMASSYFKTTFSGRDHSMALRYLDAP